MAISWPRPRAGTPRPVVRSSSGVYLTGPAGVGKSRLLAELQDVHEAEGDDVITITGAEAASNPPLGALLGIAPVERQASLAHAVVSELAYRSKRAPVLLMVDDAHRLDQSSAAVVHLIARSEIASVVVATRSGELVPGTVTSLWKDGLLERLELAPLSRKAISHLIEAEVGETTPESEQWLWSVSQGRPLFLREAILGARESGALSSDGGVTSIDSTMTVDWRLRDLVDAHLDRIGGNLVKAMAALALSQPVEESKALNYINRYAIDALEARGLLTRHNGTLSVAHPIYGQRAMERLSSGDLDDLRTEIATALDGAPGLEMQVCLLQLDAGAEATTDSLHSALNQAFQFGRGELAERLARAWLAKQTTAEGVSALARALEIQGKWEEADHAFEQAVSIANPASAGGIWYEWARSAFDNRGDLFSARRIAERSLESLDEPDSAVMTMVTLSCDRWVAPLDPIRESFESLYNEADLDERAASQLPLEIMATALQSAHLERSLDLIEASFQSTFHNRTNHWRAGTVAGLAKAWGLGIHKAEEDAARWLESAETSGYPDDLAYAHSIWALITSPTGRARRTLRHLNEADRYLARSVERGAGLLLAERALALSALRGVDDRARKAVRQLDENPPSARGYVVSFAHVVNARLVWRDGDTELANELFSRGIGHAAEMNYRLQEIPFLREYIYLFGATLESVSRMAELAQTAGIGLPLIVAEEVNALREEDPDALDRVALMASDYGASSIAWEASAVAQRLHLNAGHMRKALSAKLRFERMGLNHPDQHSLAASRIRPVLTER